MKILLFNDNPVVRKLVTLSAQKTKDDLSVVWSTDEIEESKYDLLIIDDALYSDETLESINEKIVAKSTLFMATRGKAVPSGFDNVINKPFLPTDLVDMFVQIDKKVVAGSDRSGDESEERASSASMYSINLEDSLSDFKEEVDKPVLSENLEEEEEEIDFGDLEDYQEKFPETAILDQEEVQEVQGLLDDTEEDDLNMEEEFTAQGIDTIGISEEDVGVPIELEDDFSLEVGDTNIIEEAKEDEGFDDLDFSLPLEENAEVSEEDELLGFDSGIDDIGLSGNEEMPKSELLEEEGFDDLDLSLALEEELEVSDKDELVSMGEESAFDEAGLEELESSSLMDDDALGDLELKIEDAVSGLESEELERELESDDFNLDLNDEIMEELISSEQESNVDTIMDDSESFDELDMLDERELKMAVGEEVEDEEPTITIAEGGSSLAAETLDEVINETPMFDELAELTNESEPASHAEGVEALQALLKALSNDNVAKSLKGMNISININFGNDA